MPSKPQVLVADDHQMVREAIEVALAEHYEILPGASSLSELNDRMRSLSPDVAIVDFSWTGEGSCLRHLRQCKTLRPSCRLIVLTAFDEPVVVQECLRAGACGFVLKRSGSMTELREAIEVVLQGREFVSPGVPLREPHPQDHPRNAISRPSRRVLELLVEGYSQRQIARTLNLKLRTVEDHVRRLKERFDIPSRSRPDWRALWAVSDCDKGSLNATSHHGHGARAALVAGQSPTGKDMQTT